MVVLDHLLHRTTILTCYLPSVSATSVRIVASTSSAAVPYWSLLADLLLGVPRWHSPGDVLTMLLVDRVGHSSMEQWVVSSAVML